MRVTGRSRGEYKGPESTAPSSAISGGSVAAEQSHRTSGTLAPLFYHQTSTCIENVKFQEVKDSIYFPEL